MAQRRRQHRLWPFRVGRRCPPSTGWRPRWSASVSPTRPTHGRANCPAARHSEWRLRARLWPQPEVLLLDEPFSALDAFTRRDLQDHLLDLWADTRPTLVLVTHDVDEAVVLADRVFVMRPRPGRLFEEIKVNLAAAARSQFAAVRQFQAARVDRARSLARPQRARCRAEIDRRRSDVVVTSAPAPITSVQTKFRETTRWTPPNSAPRRLRSRSATNPIPRPR